MKRRLLVSGVLLGWLASQPSAAQDQSEGERAFQVCVACHHERADATGPELRTVLGRKAGSVAGYRYSNAMKRSTLIWTVETLRAFLRDPQAVIKGNRMPLSGLRDAQQIEALLSYLQSLRG